ncbi:hypothetical protein GQ44DRAFT_741588 [Phaeosphaeriaceae sp. PMI808]|nr:hypothetical protein GQ44DRAFT_741588 [Phaeosphaeriaceae sp. PMI808]
MSDQDDHHFVFNPTQPDIPPPSQPHTYARVHSLLAPPNPTLVNNSHPNYNLNSNPSSTPFYGALHLSPRPSPYPFSDDYFNEAYHPSLSPAPQNFLDAILNPARLDHNRFSPFTYQPALHPFQQLERIAPDMPPVTRARPQASRPARLPNGYVDLTSTPDLPPQTRKRESPTPGPSAKRQRRESGNAATAQPITVEEVDLTEDKTPIQQALQKQREAAARSQTKPEEKPTTFNTFTCVICMDIPTDLTATACGHLFCHTCLNEALIAGENRAGPGEQKRSQCPVCRKFINRSKTTDIIPLLLKKGLTTQPRKKAPVAPTAAGVKV